MSDTRRYNLRLDNSVADYYDEIARVEGIATPTIFRKILTNHMHTIAMKTQADRIENLVDELSNKIDQFEENNHLKETYFEDFSGLYMMLLWLLMKNGASKDEIRSMQAKAAAYAENNFLESK